MITEELLFIMLYITGFFVFVIIITYLYLTVKNRAEVKVNHSIKQYIQQNSHNWFEYLVLNKPLMIGKLDKKLNNIHNLAIDRLFMSYVSTIKNEDVIKNISNYAEENMQSFYGKKLNSHRWATRINCLKKIRLYNLTFLHSQIEEKLKNRQFNSNEEIKLALLIMAKLDLNKFFELKNINKIKLQEYDYKVLLSHLSIDEFVKLIKSYDNLPLDFRLAILDTLSFETTLREDFLLLLEDQLSSYEQEIRIRALKGIRSFGMITTLEKYEIFVDSPIWEERFMLASILRFDQSETSYQMLKTLMHDSNWNVRKEAALSLKQKRNGERVLREILDRKEDLYAAEMSREILNIG